MRALPRSHTRSTQWTDDSLESVHSNEWCTGEDSNLRTSQGGADLQSAGFNHSPTCAETPTASPSFFVRAVSCLQRMPRKIEELNARGNPLARKHLTWKNFLMECRWKICYAAAPPKCPAFQNISWSWRRDLNP